MISLARGLGKLFQALILGVALFLAIGGLVALEAGARLFRYQAF